MSCATASLAVNAVDAVRINSNCLRPVLGSANNGFARRGLQEDDEALLTTRLRNESVENGDDEIAQTMATTSLILYLWPLLLPKFN